MNNEQKKQNASDLACKVVCAMTHDMQTCEDCKMCKGKNFAEIRTNLMNELNNMVVDYISLLDFYRDIGKEIGKQFNIKKKEKSAEEMFEELEYFKKIDNEHYLHYETNNRDGIFSEYMVVFDKRFKTYFAQCYDEPMNIDIDTQKAINKQLNELGWL